MFGLGGLGLRMMIAAIIIAVITASIGSFFLYHKSIINDLQETIVKKEKIINTQKEQIAGLVIDKEKLELSNASLEGEIARKSNETKEVFAEISRLRKKDIASTTRLQKVERILSDKNRLERIEAIRNTRKASLLLRLMNANVKCYAENFNKVEGRCIRGKWINDGERLVPPVPSEPAKTKTSKETVE